MEHNVGRLDELPENDALTLDVDGRPVGVFKVGHKVYAVRNLCPHKRAPLARGTVEGTMLPTACAGEYRFGMEGQVLKCPWHGWELNIETGQCLFGVSDSRVKTYRVSVRDGDVYVDI
ncbi:Rieske (2Fe-2S) protein [Paraburkholderia unamae]|uniref:Nitrite reductase/ring-hydroxylating ferredoxin subunit n=1 Tax=Paraburkholderia unamae TaxID=219649 RepID=A0ABX5KPY1_9BURK|nr:Rieske (2Fe-2S) protein [Paraburkholderia unamae]PVX81642.1 nitrite reductase/ring-hydroxylating ferredoxin subunit [Paraburkholderia unamae]